MTTPEDLRAWRRAHPLLLLAGLETAGQGEELRAWLRKQARQRGAHVAHHRLRSDQPAERVLEALELLERAWPGLADGIREAFCCPEGFAWTGRRHARNRESENPHVPGVARVALPGWREPS